MKKLLEICCVSLKDCINADKNGADRIELCASMAAGGLTPSFGLFQLAKEHCHIPIMIMIRPRGAGFCYNTEDFAVMKKDAELFLQNGADGIVFGCLTKDRHVDVEKCKQLCELAHHYGKEAVFHRAIDQCEDILQEAKALVMIGIDRVLSAGGPGNAEEHIDVLSNLQRTYSDKMQVQMCGSIREHNVERLVKQCGVFQIHTACRVFKQDESDTVCSELNYGNAYDKVCADQVKAMVNLLHEF